MRKLAIKKLIISGGERRFTTIRKEDGMLQRCFSRVVTAFAATGVMVLLATSISWADPCVSVSLGDLFNGPSTCVVPEGPGIEPIVRISVTGATFDAAGGGFFRLVGDPITPQNPLGISDLLAFTNIMGTATLIFVSDNDTGLPPILPPGLGNLPLLGSFNENTLVQLTLNVNGGVPLGITICSDIPEDMGGCGGSDSITMQVIPEPATLSLLGTGLLGLAGFLGRRLRSAGS